MQHNVEESIVAKLLEKEIDYVFPGLPSGSDHKEFAYNAGDPVSIPGLGRFPWRRK